jgi:hypothetical protein
MVSQLVHTKENLLALSIVSAGYTDDDQGEEHYEDIKLEVCDAMFSRCFSVVFSMGVKAKALEVGNYNCLLTNVQSTCSLQITYLT